MKAIIFDDQGLLKRLDIIFSYCIIDEDSYNTISNKLYNYIFETVNEDAQLAINLITDIQDNTIIINEIIYDAINNYLKFLIMSINNNNKNAVFDLINNNYQLSGYILIKPTIGQEIINIISKNYHSYIIDEIGINSILTCIIDYIIYKLIICNHNNFLHITFNLLDVLSSQLQGFNNRILSIEVTSAYKIMMLTKNI